MSKKKKNKSTFKKKPFDDNTLMYFGEHKDTKLANLSDHYCRWLLKQDWIKEHKELYAYLLDNENIFNNECDATESDIY